MLYKTPVPNAYVCPSSNIHRLLFHRVPETNRSSNNHKSGRRASPSLMSFYRIRPRNAARVNEMPRPRLSIRRRGSRRRSSSHQRSMSSNRRQFSRLKILGDRSFTRSCRCRLGLRNQATVTAYGLAIEPSTPLTHPRAAQTHTPFS